MKLQALSIITAAILGTGGIALSQEIGDTMDVCTWAKERPTDQAMGYKYRCTLAGTRAPSASSRIDSFTVIGVYQNYTWQMPEPPFPDSGIWIKVYLTSGVPPAVKRSSSAYQSCMWITQVSASWDLMKTVKFCYPVLPAGKNYAMGDSFTVTQGPDTIGRFGCTVYPQYFSTRPVFLGKVYGDTTDLTKNFPMVLVPGTANPYRLTGIIAPGSLLRAQGLECFTCWHALYGLELVSYMGLSKSDNAGVRRSGPALHASAASLSRIADGRRGWLPNGTRAPAGGIQARSISIIGGVPVLTGKTHE